LVYYQPQVDEWKDYKELNARMAVELKPSGGEPIPGVVYLHFLTSADVPNHTVTLTNLEIRKTNFPSVPPEHAQKVDALVRSFLPPTFATTISLDRLVASADKAKVQPRTVEVKNDPPQIFVSYTPAILLQIDGEPVRRKVKDSDLEFVVNANFPVFAKEKKTEYYLLVGNQWLTAKGFDGQWVPAKELPKDLKKIAKDPFFKEMAASIPTTITPSSAPVPQVFYSSTPAEVLLFDGQPVYAKVPTTDLVYATNTDSDIFVYSPSKTYYYLTAGRWFSAPDLKGPWKFATPDLPKDFWKIPKSSPASRVLAFVPGTPEAADAVLLAQVPTKIKLDPKQAAAQVKVSYAGDPQFKPIEGTSLKYASNTSDKVIQVGNEYYACYQGAWFKSSSPNGPWQTAESVPKEIYSIPPSSPVYNVTYVTQTTTSDGDVEASYTAGYMGMFVTGMTMGMMIGWGTGYYYPPYWGGGYYYGYPRTYGYYGGGYYGGYGAYGGARYHSGYNAATGRYGRGATAYGPYGSRSVGQTYNPYTGTYARGASARTAYGSTGAARAYNPETGARGATRQSSSPYAQWGSSAVARGDQAAVGRHYSDSRGTVGSVQTSSGASAVGARTASGNAVAGRSASGDLYAGRDGNVYRNNSGSWQKYDSGNWNSVDPSSTQAGQRAQDIQQQRGSSDRQSSGDRQYSRPDSSQMQSLQTDAQSRQRGSSASRSFESTQRSSGSSSRSYGGGRARGGGRRR
jgi:hypothetical protein